MDEGVLLYQLMSTLLNQLIQFRPFDPGLASNAELKSWNDDVFWGGI